MTKIKHGTYAGYQAEKRYGLAPCRACSTANADYTRSYRRTHPDSYRDQLIVQAATVRALWRLRRENEARFQRILSEELGR